MKRVGAIRESTAVHPAALNIPSSPHQAQLTGVDSLDAIKYPVALSMYSEPPLCEVTIEEFEELALSRLEGTYSDVVYITLL